MNRIQNENISLRLLSTEEIVLAYPLSVMLNAGLTEERYIKRISVMVGAGFQMVGAFDDADMIGVSGFWISTKIYCGKYLEPDNFIIHPDYRSQGIGKLLLDKMTEIAHQNACEVMMLDSYIVNTPSHVFYEREGFRKKGYHFVKKLVAVEGSSVCLD